MAASLRGVCRRGLPALVGALALLAGCQAPLGLEPAPAGEQLRLAQRSILTSSSLSPWTVNVLELEGLPPHASEQAAARLAELIPRRPDADPLVALAEVSFALGVRDPSQRGWEHLVVAALASWTALFREEGDLSRFGARWELARALHNASLARAVARVPSLAGVASSRIDCTILGNPARIDYQWDAEPWSPEVFVNFVVADDFRVRGMRNRHRSSGIGGALLGERMVEDASSMPDIERFLPPSYQTVALSVVMPEVTCAPGSVWPPESFSLRMVDPNRTPTTTIAGRSVPLESDFTAALAHTLGRDRPVRRAGFGGLLDVAQWESYSGLYMLEPFDPRRTPVIFVHGLVSSPFTWRQMINDLWSDEEIRSRYQFWFFMYPTGQPFVVSAAALRRDLRQARELLDPQGASASFDEIVLIGHSMGGLLSRMLTTDPGDALWSSVSSVPLEETDLSEDDRAMLKEYFFSPPVPEVTRVIFLAVPHRGSSVADATPGRLGARLIRLPPALIEAATRIFQAHPDEVRLSPDRRWPVATSIHSLSPNSPLLQALAELRTAPGVATHSIMGRRDGGTEAGGTDGVVTFESAHLAGVESELVIPGANHSVPLHPVATVEVRRILLAHGGAAAAGPPGRSETVGVAEEVPAAGPPGGSETRGAAEDVRAAGPPGGSETRGAAEDVRAAGPPGRSETRGAAEPTPPHRGRE